MIQDPYRNMKTAQFCVHPLSKVKHFSSTILYQKMFGIKMKKMTAVIYSDFIF